MANEWITRNTLLSRAQNPDDQQAWNEFVSYYQQFIHVVLHQMGLQLSDFDDVVQEVLIKIWKNLKKFEVAPDRARFRTWLSTLIRNTVIDYIRSKKSYERKTEKAIEEFNNSAHIISQSEFDEIVKNEWEQYITQTALENIRKHFSGDAISVFEMSLDDVSIDEIAKAHNIKYDSVRNLRNRVKKKLIAEIQRLKSELEF